MKEVWVYQILTLEAIKRIIHQALTNIIIYLGNGADIILRIAESALSSN